MIINCRDYNFISTDKLMLGVGGKINEPQNRINQIYLS